MLPARPPMWRRMRRCPALVVFALAFPALFCALVGPDPHARETRPWDGDPANGTVEVSTGTLTLEPGETRTHQLRLTAQPVKMNRDGTYIDCDLNTPAIDICPDDGWWVRIRIDGVPRDAGKYEGFSWMPSVGWEFDRNNWNVWRTVYIKLDEDATSSKSIAISHEVWANGSHCPVHDVGSVEVNGGTVSPPPPTPENNNGNETGDGANNNGDGGNLNNDGDGNGGGGGNGGNGGDGGNEGNGGNGGNGGGNGGNGDNSGNGGNGGGGDDDRDDGAPPPLPALSIGDAVVNEGDTALFPVTLSAESAQTVTVRYQTQDGTAVSGADFEAMSGTLTFDPGTRRQAIEVRTLADDIEEPRETFTVSLSGPTGATLADGTALGIIAADPEGRIADASDVLLPAIGRAMAFTAVRCRIEQAFSHVSAGMVQPAVRPSLSVAPVPGPWGASGDASLGLEEVLDGASFLLPLMSVDAGAARFATWGCGDFRDLAVAIVGETDGGTRTWDGAVSTVQLGIDALLDSDTLAGVALSRSRGSFDHRRTGANGGTGGDVDLRLTGVHPYVAFSLSPDLRAWATIGIAGGDLEVRDDRAGETLSNSATLLAGTVGLNGRLLTTEETTVTLKGEAGFARLDASSAEAAFRTASADLHRLRFAAEAGYKFLIPNVGLLTPWGVLGLRHDGGDGETGASLEMGSGLRYRNIEQGWTAEAYGRWLALHDDGLPEEQGYGLRFRYDPGALGFGPWVSLTQTWGEPTGEVQRLWEDGALGLAGDRPSDRRLDLEFGYGLPAFRGRAAFSPYSAMSLVNTDAQSYRLGVRLSLGPSALLNLETERRERPAAPTDHRIMARAIARL